MISSALLNVVYKCTRLFRVASHYTFGFGSSLRGRVLVSVRGIVKLCSATHRTRLFLPLLPCWTSERILSDLDLIKT